MNRAKLLKGEADVTIGSFTRVIESTFNGRPKPNILTGNWWVRRGEAYRLLGDYQRAEKDFEDALRVLHMYEYWRWELLAISALGEIHLLRRDYGSAKQKFESALQIAILDRNPYGIAACQYRLGLVEHLSGHLEEAKALYNKVFKCNFKPILYATYIKAAILSRQLSGEYPDKAAGHLETSREQVSKGIQLCRDILKDSGDYFDVKINLALALLLEGQDADAAAFYENLWNFCLQHRLKGAEDAIMMDIELLKRVPVASFPNMRPLGPFYEVYTGDRVSPLARKSGWNAKTQALTGAALAVVAVAGAIALQYLRTR